MTVGIRSAFDDGHPRETGVLDHVATEGRRRCRHLAQEAVDDLVGGATIETDREYLCWGGTGAAWELKVLRGEL